jgi:beta-galactosidase
MQCSPQEVGFLASASVRRHPGRLARPRGVSAPLLLLCLFCSTAPLIGAPPALRSTDRITVFLDGPWQISESVSPEEQPVEYRHTVIVPGLVNQARPGFRNVDRLTDWKSSPGQAPAVGNASTSSVEAPLQTNSERNYFWYRRTFVAPALRSIALLHINKAQFGTAVWLNGKPMGEYMGCFSSSTFNVTDAIRMPGTNTLVVRVGAHPGVLPGDLPIGADPEKYKWTPGIYDRISLRYSDNPVIEWVQTAADLDKSEVQLQTKIRNYGAATKFELRQTLRTFRSGKAITNTPPALLQLKAGEGRIVTTKLRVPAARLWSPQDPFLYAVDTRTGGDSLTTRFGMREFRSDPTTGLFHLNGRPIMLRGSNIALHRFFEDPLCENLPWNEGWTRKLLVDIPRQMNWNSVRFFLGPVPDRWYELADEAGLLIENEFFLSGRSREMSTNQAPYYDPEKLIAQYGDWMRDSWNHPSVVIWDACDGKVDSVVAERVIPSVRKLDLSNRPWVHGANPPVSPDDPVEFCASLFRDAWQQGPLHFATAQLEAQHPKPETWRLAQNNHPILLNQYGWLWLNRDGTPTLNSSNTFEKLLGPGSSVENRFGLAAYLMAAETEYWRSTRLYAGILHFAYLTSSHRKAWSSDPFRELRTLRLDDRFADYVGNAFKPLGVCLQFFQTELASGEDGRFIITLVNDDGAPASGRLQLTLETMGSQVKAQADAAYEVPALGKQQVEVVLAIPAASGRHVLKAAAYPLADRPTQPTVSRRWVEVTGSPR